MTPPTTAPPTVAAALPPVRAEPATAPIPAPMAVFWSVALILAQAPSAAVMVRIDAMRSIWLGVVMIFSLFVEVRNAATSLGRSGWPALFDNAREKAPGRIRH